LVHLLLEANADVSDGFALRIAAGTGHAAIAKMLIQAKAGLNSGALEAAVWIGSLEIARMLLDAGAKADFSLAVEIAIEGGYTDFIDILLCAGLDKCRAIQIAVEHGPAKVVRMLLDAGAEVRGDEILVQTAARRGSAEVVGMLLDAGARFVADLKSCQRACESGHLELVQMMIDTEVLNKHTKVIDLAAEHGHAEIVRILIGAGITAGMNDALKVVDRVLGNEILHQQIARRDLVEIIGMLLDAGARFVDTLESCQRACESGRLEIVQIMIDAGVLNKHTRIISVAARHGHAEIVRILISAGITTGMNDALDAAVSEGHREIMDLLIGAGARLVNLVGLIAGWGRALQKAAQAGQSYLIVILLRTVARMQGLPVEETSDNAVPVFTDDRIVNELNEALNGAVLQSHLKVVRILMDAGASVSDYHIATAENMEYTEIVDVLRKSRTVRDRKAA
jgi:ankyrin repeat protein